MRYTKRCFIFVVWACMGFIGGQAVAKSHKVVTVAQALKLPDDTLVVLDGYVVSERRSEEYNFKDHTGTITVEIDYDKWHGMKMDKKQKVRIEGEIEKDDMRTKIDVDRITKLP